MKVLRLELIAFGPFTDVALDLHQGEHGLHLIYGPNEAGKTSALRGLSQWFFGMPRRSLDAFLHPADKLRVGGVVQAEDGRTIHCIRRRGVAQSLRDHADRKKLDAQLFEQLLGGVQQREFETRFGVNYQQLTEAGAAMVHGGGELSDIIFAASTGIHRWQQLHEDLIDEAEAIFKPRGSTQQIAATIREYDRQRTEMKQHLLTRAQWTDFERRWQQTQQEKLQVDQRLAELRRQHELLKRYRDALPYLGRRHELVRRLATATDVPELPAGFDERRVELTRQQARLQAKVESLTERMQKLQSEIAEQRFSGWLLDQHPAIDRLNRELGGFLQARLDQPMLQAQINQLQKEAAAGLRQVQHYRPADAESRLPDRPLRRHIAHVAGEHRQLRRDLLSAEEELAKSRRRCEQAADELAEPLSNFDTTALSQLVSQARQAGDLDGKCDSLARSLAAHRVELTQRLHSLPWWNGDAEQFHQLQLPAQETVDRYAEAFQQQQQRQQRLADRQATVQQRIVEIEKRLQAMQLELQTPTEEDLHAARQLRNRTLDQLIGRLSGGELLDEERGAESELSARTPASPAAQAEQLRGQIQQADELADRLRREAHHVAEKTGLLAEAAQLRQRGVELATEQTNQQAELTDLQLQWNRLWQDLTDQPGSPVEMRGWLRDRADLLELYHTAAGAAVQLDQSQADRERWCGRLRRQLEEFERMAAGQCSADLADLQPADSAADLQHLVQTAERIVRLIERQQQRWHDGQRQRAALREDQQHAEMKLESLRQQLTEWEATWQQLREDAAVDDVPPERMLEILEVWESHERLQAEINSRLERVGQMQELIDRFEQAADVFRRRWTQNLEPADGQLAGELPGLDTEALVLRARAELNRASETRGVREQLAQQIQVTEAARASDRHQLEQLEAELHSLCHQAGCTALDDLPQQIQRANQRRTWSLQLQEVEARLAELAHVESLDQFLAAASDHDASELAGRISELEGELMELEQLQAELQAHLGGLRKEREWMRGSGEAANRQQEIEQTLATMRSEARQYVQLRAADWVLQQAIDRYRDRHQAPVLSLAGRWFAELTLGRYCGLQTDYGPQGEDVLVGVRADTGAAVGILEMSDGTRDQLYLALRLGALQHHLEHRAPLPFVVDDVLVHFDDERSLAALQAFAHFSRSTQVIFFTHHQHLVQLALDHMQDEQVFVHKLERP